MITQYPPHPPTARPNPNGTAPATSGPASTSTDGPLTGATTSPGRLPAATSPYQWALPRGADVVADPLRLRLGFHEESVVLHEFADGLTRVRSVLARAVAHALAGGIELTSGLLPPDALWWANTPAGTRVAVWREPRVWTVRLRERPDAPPQRLRLPMPGLVFICLPARQARYVFAAKARPRTPEAQLYHAPAYNVFGTGRVCPGTHVFPADPARVPEEFFRSHFAATADTATGRSHRHPDDIGRLWTELHRQAVYPLEDLLPHLTVADAMRLGER